MSTAATDVSEVTSRLREVLDRDERSRDEHERLLDLMSLFAGLPLPPDPFDLYPRYGDLKERFVDSTLGSNGVAIEEAFLALYAHVHGYDVPYTEEERQRVLETGGYLCHVGGLTPILKAAPYLDASSVSADYGAGNGLQGLLIQKLRPHRKTVQIEISSRMVEAGKKLQDWLGIPRERVEWRTSHVSDVSPVGIDFIYIYRPVRPTGEGERFYRDFAARLAESTDPVVIFSIADCLRSFLPPTFDVFFSDGHLTCFRRK
jgi:hypothetical protein